MATEVMDGAFFDLVFGNVRRNTREFITMMTIAVQERNIALLNKVKACFNAQYKRLPIGPAAKNLLQKQQFEMKTKKIDEKAPQKFFCDLLKQKQVIHPQMVWEVSN